MDLDNMPTCCALANSGERCRQYAREDHLTCRVHANREAVFDDLQR